MLGDCGRGLEIRLPSDVGDSFIRTYFMGRSTCIHSTLNLYGFFTARQSSDARNMLGIVITKRGSRRERSSSSIPYIFAQTNRMADHAYWDCVSCTNSLHNVSTKLCHRYIFAFTN